MALYGRDANGNDAYIRATGAGSTSDGFITFHDVFSNDIRFRAVDLSASGDVLPAVAGVKLRVVSYTISVSAACTVQFQSDEVDDITGTFHLAANEVVSVNNPLGAFETDTGDKLNVVITGAADVGITLSYRQV